MASERSSFHAPMFPRFARFQQGKPAVFMAEKFFIIDGHSHLFRAFYAVRGLTAPDGRPSSAVFGFTAMLRKLLQDQKPDYLAVAFDTPSPTFRHRLYPGYKATREKPPEEFSVQVPMVKEVLEAMNVPVFAVPGYEADDVLGTLAVRAARQGVDVVIVTGDKDALQLLGPRVTLLDTLKEQTTTEATLRERDGIAPAQVVEVMALSGDTSDNVPGIPKVGPKTALKLIAEYGTLESVLEHAAEIKTPALRANLQEHADLARLSRKLVTIDTDVPLDFALEACRVKPPDPRRLASVYEKFNFRQFLAELDLPATQETAAYRLVDTPEAFEAFLRELRRQKRFALDLETTSPAPRAAKIVGLSFSWKEREAWYLALRGPLGARTLHAETVLNALRPILTDPAVAKAGQNIKYDMIVLRSAGIALEGVAFDTMVAAHVLNAERRSYGLDALAADFLNYRMTPITDLIGKGKSQRTMDQAPVDAVCAYACADADITWRLTQIFQADLAKEPALLKLFNEIELPLISVLADIEYHGIGFDPSVLAAMSGWLEGEIARVERAVHQAAGETFNIASPKQLAAVLFEKLGLPRGRRTKTGASTDSDVLEQLAVNHPLPALVLEYRQLTKLKSTYVDALPRMALPQTGRIHTSLNQIGAATGRLSSSEPNLQNIPVRTEIGERIRRAFVPTQPDLVFLSADYSQIELRILAHLSGDASLRQAFAQDEDIHRFVAAQIHGVAPAEVTSAMRRAAKAVNFGIVYGQTPFGLSRELQIPVEEADRFIKEYFGRYPGVKDFIDRTIAQAHKDGAVQTVCGRRRPLSGLAAGDRNVRQFAERAAVNTVIQGTAADMIKIAMVRIPRLLRDAALDARMVLQIHDELLFELSPSDVERVRAVIVPAMTGALRLDVPVKVNIAVGPNWMEAK